MDIPLAAGQRNHGTVNFIMLNPSTATRECNDRTVDNCEQLAQDWGHANLVVTNLFAYRTPDPEELRNAPHPIGPDNNQHLIAAARDADLRIAAWGGAGKSFCLWEDRATWLRIRLHVEQLELMCLVRNKHYHPRHPGRITIGDFPRENLQRYDLGPDLAAVLAPL